MKIQRSVIASLILYSGLHLHFYDRSRTALRIQPYQTKETPQVIPIHSPSVAQSSKPTETKAGVEFKAGVKDYRITHYTLNYQTKENKYYKSNPNDTFQY